MLRTSEDYTLTPRRPVTDHGLGVRLDGDRTPDQRARQQQQRHDGTVSAIRRHHVGDARSPGVSCSGWRRRPVPGSRLRGRQTDFPDTRYPGLATLVSSAARSARRETNHRPCSSSRVLISGETTTMVTTTTTRRPPTREIPATKRRAIPGARRLVADSVCGRRARSAVYIYPSVRCLPHQTSARTHAAVLRPIVVVHDLMVIVVVVVCTHTHTHRYTRCTQTTCCPVVNKRENRKRTRLIIVNI